MGGTLLLAESSSAGSVFELRLHLRPATLPRVPVAGQASLRVSGHVLVVDDNRVNRDIASAMLRYAGCTVDVASGGQEAIEAVEHRAYDLVFMDCQMPGMDGYEATSRLRSLGYGSSRLPIVALTAGALAEDRARSLEAGMNDHLSKPLLEDPLLAVLARWLPHAAVAVPKLRADAAATAQAADQPPLFNMETVRRTRELMEEIPGSWEAMVASFITYGTQLIERLTDAVGDARTGEVRQQAHNMKGTAAMIGALRLSSWAADLEQAAQDERMMMCVQLMPRLRAEFDAVARALSSNEFD
jgi:CheY-like chemotaxis protein/HPt (histidine-containing phosphotransfer) domain-containing protein